MPYFDHLLVGIYKLQKNIIVDRVEFKKITRNQDRDNLSVGIEIGVESARLERNFYNINYFSHFNV